VILLQALRYDHEKVPLSHPINAINPSQTIKTKPPLPFNPMPSYATAVSHAVAHNRHTSPSHATQLSHATQPSRVAQILIFNGFIPRVTDPAKRHEV